jgi:hypothetical protein
MLIWVAVVIVFVLAIKYQPCSSTWKIIGTVFSWCWALKKIGESPSMGFSCFLARYKFLVAVQIYKQILFKSNKPYKAYRVLGCFLFC